MFNMTFDDPTKWSDEGVVVVPHDPSWGARFEQEVAVIEKAIGQWITGGVHHIGSTAVPGLSAKPIIDIAVGVDTLEGSRPCIAMLREAQYLYSPYRGDVMHWFCKPDPARRTHHLHLIPTGSTRLNDEIIFRDYLTTHPIRAREYGNLKERLAAEHADDREAYTRAKADFVETLTAQAHAWRRAASS